VIEKPILKLLGIDRNTELAMKTDGERLIIAPVKASSRRERMAKTVDEVMTRHFETMKKLAR
jgi:antitoxin MazE